MDFDSVTFFLNDVKSWHHWFTDVLGFVPQSTTTPPNAKRISAELISPLESECSAAITSQNICFQLASPSTASSAIAQYLNNHPAGVADIAFSVKDLDAAYQRAVDAGAKPLQNITHQYLPIGRMKQATISGWGDLRHTLVEYIPDPASTLAPSPPSSQTLLSPKSSPLHFPKSLQNPTPHPLYFTAIDHAVMNVPIGDMEKAANWYINAFGFECQQTFEIQTPHSALRSMVLTHPNGNATLPINEPASSHSQIQEFLNVNRGSGIQHIAMSTPDIVQTMAYLRQKGLAFLHVPPSYYDDLPSRSGFHETTIDWEAIASQGILVDWQDDKSDALLLQAFTQPIFAEPTFFFEVIQRQDYFNGTQYQQAAGFGEGNFQALFEAIEREQMKRGSLPLR